MKKKTNVQTSAAGGEDKPRPRGPQKEKTQVTLRLDKQLMDEVYVQMKEDNSRITDMIERGLVLALAETRHQLPAWTKQIRFVLANATQEQVRLIRGLAVRMVEPHLDKNVFVSYAAGDKLGELLKWWLETANKEAHATTCLEYYSRYGKSAEEIARLGSL